MNFSFLKFEEFHFSGYMNNKLKIYSSHVFNLLKRGESFFWGFSRMCFYDPQSLGQVSLGVFGRKWQRPHQSSRTTNKKKKNKSRVWERTHWQIVGGNAAPNVQLDLTRMDCAVCVKDFLKNQNPKQKHVCNFFP